jgi:hypothetical protein
MRRTHPGRRTPGRVFAIKRINSADLCLGFGKVLMLVSGLRTCSMMLGLSLLTLVGATPAFAKSPEEKVAEATQAWVDAFSGSDPADLEALYDENAVFWPTSSNVIRTDPAGVLAYFTSIFQVLTNREVEITESHIRVYGHVGINTGAYTVSGTLPSGASLVQRARFSFTYVNHGNSWLIVDHHSSVLPANP